MADFIVEHESWHKASLETLVRDAMKNNGLGAPPPLSHVQNKLWAEVNHGRWIVTCPSRCGGAIIVSSHQPLFLCPDCGSSENGGKWYNVIFPANKEAIEKLLLKRPAFNPMRAANRNWKPDESVSDLEWENQERGID